MSAPRKYVRLQVIAISLAALLGLPRMLPAETVSAMPANKGFFTIKEILDTSCSACHDWTGSYQTIVGGGRVIAGAPEKSLLYVKVASDEMPQDGDKLTADQKAFIRGWIAAGAPSSDLPIAVPAAEAPPASSEAAASATAAAAPAPSQGFLFFPSKVSFHAVTGFTSSALFLGAGVIGVVHFVDMMNEGHILRDQINFQEGSPESQRIPLVEQAWGSDSALRWWHVGFIVAGETLYIGDAVTGISMMTKQQPGKLSKHDIHRDAFFVHLTLMAAQIGLGLAETYALSTGQHDLMIGLGAAHAAIGLAIPVVMIGAGLENLFLPE
jgi:hypothetical protein